MELENQLMLTSQNICFSVDGALLIGSLHLPGVHQPPFVIGCHGLLSDRKSPKQIALAEALNRIGIAYFRFDHRGCGESGGKFDISHLLSSRCKDLLEAIRYIQSHPQVGPFAGLFGSSFGGTVCLCVASDITVPAVITYAAPIDSLIIKKPTLGEINSIYKGQVPAQTDFDFDILDILWKLNHILIMHGEKDEVVPLEHAYKIYENAKDPKKLIVHKGGDHRMSNPNHQDDFIVECVSWFKKFYNRTGFNGSDT
jgi:alpha/beta superfamily hydrolase